MENTALNVPGLHNWLGNSLGWGGKMYLRPNPLMKFKNSVEQFKTFTKSTLEGLAASLRIHSLAEAGLLMWDWEVRAVGLVTSRLHTFLQALALAWMLADGSRSTYLLSLYSATSYGCSLCSNELYVQKLQPPKTTSSNNYFTITFTTAAALYWTVYSTLPQFENYFTSKRFP